MSTLTHHRILAVEDSPTVVAWLREQLPASAHDLKVASSGADALALFQESHYDLILINEELSDTRGCELIQKLRSDERCEDVPIALLTSQEPEQVIDQAFAAGADEFISKPLKPNEFHSRLAQCVLRKKESAEAKLDPLTNSLSRRSMWAALNRATAKAGRTTEALSLLLVDLDNTKSINDLQGHLAGDAVLVHVASIWRKCLRPYDLLFRYGGDEFIVLLPATSADEACQVGNKLRQSLATKPCPYHNKMMTVTLSCGVAEWVAGETVEDWIERADQAQYEAKSQGGDQLVVSQRGAKQSC